MQEGRQALLKEWAADKNFPLRPEAIPYGSTKMVWWQCKKGHEWRATIHSRTEGCGCPVCAGVVNGKRRVRYENMLAEAKTVMCGHLRENQLQK